jgi:hypothetical protein
MASIAIMIGTPEGSRTLGYSSEREAADAAEMILRRIPITALPAPIWIQCDDVAVANRLADYLAGVQAELMRG